MADHVFTEALVSLWGGADAIDLQGDDIRCMLVMTNTTADTEVDAKNPADLTTLDEFDGSGYARQALGSEAVNLDLANDRAEFDAADVAFGALGNGTRQIQGYLLIKHVDGSDANDLLLMYKDFASPINPGGSTFTIQWNAEGIMQHVNA
jgi:hypothetical protein